MNNLSELKARHALLWELACKSDGIDPVNKFVAFSNENPFAVELNLVAGELNDAAWKGDRCEDVAMKLSHQVGEQTNKLMACEAQRDELLAACKDAVRYEGQLLADYVADHLRAAIARSEDAQ